MPYIVKHGFSCSQAKMDRCMIWNISVKLLLMSYSFVSVIWFTQPLFTRHSWKKTQSRKCGMDSRRYRRSRSGSRNRDRGTKKSRISRSRSPEDRRGRSRSAEMNKTIRRRRRSRSGDSVSSGGSVGRHRHQSGSRSDTDGEKRREGHRIKNKPKDRSRYSQLGQHFTLLRSNKIRNKA